MEYSTGFSLNEVLGRRATVETGSETIEQYYKCSRCGGIFTVQAGLTIGCPYCGMPCDEAACRLEAGE